MGQLSLWTVVIPRLGSKNDTWSVRSFLTWVSPSTDRCSPSGEDRYVFTQETDDLDRSLFDQGWFKNPNPFFDSLFSVPLSSNSQFPAGPIFLALAVALRSLL